MAKMRPWRRAAPDMSCRGTWNPWRRPSVEPMEAPKPSSSTGYGDGRVRPPVADPANPLWRGFVTVLPVA